MELMDFDIGEVGGVVRKKEVGIMGGVCGFV